MRVERLDVLHREHLEDVLVAGAAGLVAVAQLARAEDREVDARPLQQLGERTATSSCCGRRSCPRTRRSRGTRGRSAPPGSTMSTPSSALGPVAAVALVQAVRVAGVLHRAERVAELGREVALHQREVAAHVEDLVEDLDVDRADLVARLAARARPQLFGRDALEHAVGADRDVAVDADRRRHDRDRRSRPSPRRPSARSRAGRAACRSRAPGTPTCSARRPCTRRCRTAAST